MMNYKTEENFAVRELRKIANDIKKSNDVRNTAKYILEDRERLKKYVLLRIKRREDKERKKIFEEKMKNLSGWKKWFKMVLPKKLILG